MTNKQIDTLQDEADNHIDTPESETIGSILQQARLAMGASVADIAGQLHLRPCIVTDIEADRFDEIASPTYVKGYVKNFARIVQADKAAIKRCLAIQLPQAIDPQMQSFSRKTTRQARDGRLMFVTYLIGFILLALLVVWWVQKSDLLSSTDFSMPTVEEIADSSTSEHQKAEPLQAAVSSVASIAFEAEADLIKVDESTGSDESTSKSALSATDAAELNQPRLAEPVVETPIAKVVTDSSALSALLVDLSGDCWINITDSNGKILVNDLKRAGSQLNLSGEAPFKLTLGAPQSVNIVLDGKAVSLADFPSGRVARLTLPFAG